MRLDVEAALVRGELVPGDVEVADGVVVDVGLATTARGRIAVPGFVDLQVNGFAGVDFLGASTADYARAGEALLAGGVTAYQPTFITAPEATLLDALRALPGERHAAARPRRARRRPVSLARAARHASARAPARSRPRVARPAARRRAGDRAHARAGAARRRARSIARARRRGRRRLGRAHERDRGGGARRPSTSASSTVTHIFNAMRPFRSRDPGIAGVALTRRDVFVQMIVDGHHLADETVRLIWAAAAGRVALVTDATAAAGGGAGTYQLGDVEIELSTDGVPMREDGTSSPARC